eukprot:6198328-Pleurochrysis_carterae.AAC.1
MFRSIVPFANSQLNWFCPHDQSLTRQLAAVALTVNKASYSRGAQIHREERGRETSGPRCRHVLQGINSTHKETAQRCINANAKKCKCACMAISLGIHHLNLTHVTVAVSVDRASAEVYSVLPTKTQTVICRYCAPDGGYFDFSSPTARSVFMIPTYIAYPKQACDRCQQRRSGAVVPPPMLCSGSCAAALSSQSLDYALFATL